MTCLGEGFSNGPVPVPDVGIAGELVEGVDDPNVQGFDLKFKSSGTRLGLPTPNIPFCRNYV
jgi:hypothetical protein